MTKAPTVEDVALAAGVSRQTVSNVLNSPEIVKAATRERVEQAIAALGTSEGQPTCAALIDVLASDRYAYVREQAARWIGTRCADAGRSALEAAREHDPELRVREAATAAISSAAVR